MKKSIWLMTALVPAIVLLKTPAWAADTEADALDLKSAPEEPASSTTNQNRFYIEAASGSVNQRFGLGKASLRRVSLDIFHAARITPSMRMVLSNRLDHVVPFEAGVSDSFNSLREAYISWDLGEPQSVAELGRINLRQGPGYGFNPTDFFKAGALRRVISVNPAALRENRMGTVMLRFQRLWDGGSMSVALAPKLAEGPNDDSLSLDLGATNSRNRGMLTLSQQVTERFSGQVVAFAEKGRSAQVGASLTGLVSDAVVTHAEWSHAREPDLASRAWHAPGSRSGNRFAGGLTYTSSTKLSITGELQVNQLALSKADWTNALANQAAIGIYLREAERLQDLASRRAYLVHVTQRSLGLRGLDLSGFLRVNVDDRSRLTWIELRYHWANVDTALQWQQFSGKTGSQFGINPDRSIVQLLASYHFQ